MIQAYLRTKTRTKLIGAAALVALAAVISVRFNLDVLVISLFTAALIAFFHISIAYTSNLAAGLVTALQAFFVVTLSYGLVSNFATLELVVGYSTELIQLTVISIGTFVIASYILFAYLLSYGRMWVNLGVAFILFNSISTPIWALNNDLIAVGVIAGFLAGLVFLGLRTRTLRKRKPLPAKPTLNKGMRKRAERLFSELELEYRVLPNDEQWQGAHYLAYNAQQVYLIHMVNAKESFVINNRGIFADDEDISSFAEKLKLDQQGHRKMLPRNRTTSVFIMPSDKVFPWGLNSVNISKYRKPDRYLGLVVFASANRFKRLVKEGKKASSLGIKAQNRLTLN